MNALISSIYLMQVILLFTNYDITSSDQMKEFINGFQYFKFNLRFLDLIFNIRSNLIDHSVDIPSRMNFLFLESKSAII